MTKKKGSMVNVVTIDTNTDIIPYSPTNLSVLDYIPFGSDNLFPQALALFARKSPNHRGIINKKNFYLLGNSIQSEANQDILDNINYEQESLHKVMKRIELDYLMTGNGWLELITDKNQSYLYINHIDTTKCRIDKKESNVIIYPDWKKYIPNSNDTRILPLYPKFKPDNHDNFAAYRSVYHMHDYEPEFTVYGLPSWISGKDAVRIDFKTNRWNIGVLENAFKLSGLLFVPVKSPEEGKMLVDKIKSAHTGEFKQGKFMVIAKSRAGTQEKADQVEYIQNNQDQKGEWMKLHEQAVNDIIVSHSWFRSLSGIPESTGFDTQRIINEYNVALATIIKPRQQEWKECLKNLYKNIIGLDLEFEFINEPPVKLDDGMFVWEIRKRNGLEFDENDPVQNQIIYNGTIIGNNGSINNQGQNN